MPSKSAPPQLVKEANEACDLFVNSWRGIKLNEREFGRACVLLEAKQLWRYVQVPGGSRCFQSLETFVEHWTGGECTRTRMYECKRLYQLTQGENALAPEVVDEMPKKNALQVHRVRERAPKKITKSFIERARREPVTKFAVTAQSAVNDTLPVSEQESPMMALHLWLHPSAVEMLKETIEDFKLIPGAVRDGDRSLDLASKAVIAVCHSARTFAAEAIRSAKERARDQAAVVSEAEPETHTEDAATAIATATSEGRIIDPKSEARN